MPRRRMAAYLVLAGWVGVLSDVAWTNFLDARWWFLAVNVALMAVVGVVIVAMGNRDVDHGRITDRAPAPSDPSAGKARAGTGAKT